MKSNSAITARATRFAPPDQVTSEELDRITRTAARLFRMPIALVTLFDDERQWFPSRCGLELEGTPRSVSFCAHAIRQADPMVIEDALKDPRFRDNPLVTGDPHIRFYAGHTIRSRDGTPLGTLCVLDRQPRAFGVDDLAALADLAVMVEQRFHLEEATVEARSTRSTLAQREQLFSHIIDQAEVGIALLDGRGTFIQCNRRFGAACGRHAEKLPGCSFLSLIDPRDAAWTSGALADARSAPDSARHRVVRFLDPSGEIRWIQVGISSVRSSVGMPEGRIVVATDINAIHHAQEQLLSLQHELEDRIHERTKQLDTIVAELSLEIVRRKEAEARLRAEQAQRQRVLDDTSDAFVEIDGDDRILAWNGSAERVFGWTAAEALGQSFALLALPDDMRARHARWLQKLRSTGMSTRMKHRIESECIRRSGERFPVDMTFSTSVEAGRFFVHGFIQDITERKSDEAALLETKRRLETITDNVPAMIAHVGADFRYRFHNRAYANWFDIRPGDLVGTHLRDFWGDEQFSRFEDVLRRVVAGESAEIEYLLETRNGTMWFHANLVPHVGQDNHNDGFYLLSQDFTERKRLYARTEHEALHDHLTGLPNRRALMNRLEEAIGKAQCTGQLLAVMFIDLDGFKQVNDTFGHDQGDALLRRFTDRLRSAVRESDFVARLAGDEFVVVLEWAGSQHADLASMGEAILGRVGDSGAGLGLPVDLSCSIGLATYRPDALETAKDLLSRADAAMYEAKTLGKRRLVIH